MDEEAIPTLESLERRISATEKRFEDIKWYIGGASLMFSALILVLGWNFTSDRSALRDSVKDMKQDVKDLENGLKEQFGQAAVPQLVLIGTDGAPVSAQQIVPKVERDTDGAARLTFCLGLRNTGNGISGAIWLKIYTQKDMPIFNESVDDPAYPTEFWVEPGDFKPGNLPGKFSLFYTISNRLPPPLPGPHQVLAKVFYGNGHTAEAAFSLDVK
jgi:hypothetical protein